MDQPQDITEMLRRASAGDRVAENWVFDVIYGELRLRARLNLRDERQSLTLDSGALVHEAFAKLFRGGNLGEWKDRKHFFLVASRAMRQVIIEHARKRDSVKRGEGQAALALEDADVASAGHRSLETLVLVSELSSNLTRYAPQSAEVFDLVFFGGLTQAETAELLEISPDSVGTRWALAKAWLRRELTSAQNPVAPPSGERSE